MLIKYIGLLAAFLLNTAVNYFLISGSCKKTAANSSNYGKNVTTNEIPDGNYKIQIAEVENNKKKYNGIYRRKKSVSLKSHNHPGKFEN